MAIVIEWHRPIVLTNSKKLLFSINNVPENVPNESGVYYFSRKYGDVHYPFYIGETRDLRARLRSHLNSVQIVDVLRGQSGDERIKQGARCFHFGVLKRRANQDVKACIQKVQKIMIQEAIVSGLPILNKQLTTVRTNTISFVGSREGMGWFDDEYEFED